MECIIESIQVEDTKIVIFVDTSFSGMVGETVNMTSARLLDVANNEVKELTYEDLKAIHKSIEGKWLRIKFFYAMRPMSPKGLAEESERQTADAINRVI